MNAILGTNLPYQPTYNFTLQIFYFFKCLFLTTYDAFVMQSKLNNNIPTHIKLLFDG